MYLVAQREECVRVNSIGQKGKGLKFPDSAQEMSGERKPKLT